MLSVRVFFIIFSNCSKLFSGVVDQWFTTTVDTPHKENRATSWMGCSSGTKCFEVKTLRSIKFLYEFILSKITIALHLFTIERSEINDCGNLCNKQVIEKYTNKLAVLI